MKKIREGITMLSKKMSSILLFLLISQSLNAQPTYKPLFNHQNLDGWQHVGGGEFVVENGLLTSKGGMGLLWYAKQKFGNSRFRIIYKTTYAETNSGFFVRIAHKPRDQWDAVHHGYEVQICDAGADAFDNYHRTGAIYSFAKTQNFASKKPGEWNTLEVNLQNNKILVWLNGIKINEFDPQQSTPPRLKDFEPKRGDRPLYGYIGIQNHDHNALHPDSHIYIKDISYA